MDPRTRNVFAGILVVILGLTATAAILFGQAGTPTATPPPGTEIVEGVIVKVESAGLTDVKGFDLRAGDGTTLTFSLARLENGVEFPPGHLVEHQAAASPVRVWFTTEDGVRYAIRLEDAEPPG